jgi:hypothetical protein
MYFCKFIPQLRRNKDDRLYLYQLSTVPTNLHHLSPQYLLIYILFLIIYVFLILTVSISIIFHHKSNLAKNYLMYHLLDTIFNFLSNYVLLFPQQCDKNTSEMIGCCLKIDRGILGKPRMHKTQNTSIQYHI